MNTTKEEQQQFEKVVRIMSAAWAEQLGGCTPKVAFWALTTFAAAAALTTVRLIDAKDFDAKKFGELITDTYEDMRLGMETNTNEPANA